MPIHSNVLILQGHVQDFSCVPELPRLITESLSVTARDTAKSPGDVWESLPRNCTLLFNNTKYLHKSDNFYHAILKITIL